jgi:hypothetical protein
MSETNWSTRIKTTRPFPEQQEMREAAFDALDAFAPKGKKGLTMEAITDRMNPKKVNGAKDLTMMWCLEQLSAQVIMEAMGAPMKREKLYEWDGALMTLERMFDLQPQALKELPDVMLAAVQGQIHDHRAANSGVPSFGTAWQRG